MDNSVGEENARLEEIRERALYLEAITVENANQIKNQKQEIKRNKEKIEKLMTRLSELKKIYDNNSMIFNHLISEKKAALRRFDSKLKKKIKTITE